jgi:hypothetical protein
MSWSPEDYKQYWVNFFLGYGAALLVGLAIVSGLAILAARVWLVNPLIAEMQATKQAAIDALRR